MEEQSLTTEKRIMEDQSLSAKYPDRRLAFATETLKEAMTNLRHCQNMSFQVATWGTLALAAFSSWLVARNDFQTIDQRLSLCFIVIGFTTGLLVLQHNLRQQSRQALRIIAQLDKAFGCFELDAYIKGEVLFPMNWSSTKKRSFIRRLCMPVSIPLLTGLVIAIAVILFR